MTERIPSRVIAVVPGGFKPPHKGHVGLVGDYAGQADKVLVIVSSKSRDGITAEQSLAIWKIFLEELPYDNIEVMVSTNPSPVGAAFDFVENKNDDPDLAQPGDKVILGVSAKGGDNKRFCANVQKYARDGVIVEGDCVVEPVIDPETQEAFSAENLRGALTKGGDELIKFMPKEVHNRIKEIEDILAMREKKEPITLENLFDMVKEVMEEEEELDEVSTAGGQASAIGNIPGDAGGYGAPLGATPRRSKKKRKPKLKREERRRGRRIYIPD